MKNININEIIVVYEDDILLKFNCDIEVKKGSKLFDLSL